jgi:hypothetical protein
MPHFLAQLEAGARDIVLRCWQRPAGRSRGTATATRCGSGRAGSLPEGPHQAEGARDPDRAEPGIEAARIVLGDERRERGAEQRDDKSVAVLPRTDSV